MSRSLMVDFIFRVVVYKVDYFVLGTLSSSLVLLNTKVVLLSNPKDFRS